MPINEKLKGLVTKHLKCKVLIFLKDTSGEYSLKVFNLTSIFQYMLSIRDIGSGLIGPPQTLTQI